MDRERHALNDGNSTSQGKVAVPPNRGAIEREEISDQDLCICYRCGDYVFTYKLEVIHIPFGIESSEQENHVTVKQSNSYSCNEAGKFALSEPKVPIGCNLHSGKGNKCIEKHIITELSKSPRS